MFVHTVVIIRSDTAHDFYYNVSGILNDPYYLEISSQAKADGKMISEELTISEDQLMLERKVRWDSEESFNEFLNLWMTYDPDHKTKFQNYSNSVGHSAMLMV